MPIGLFIVVLIGAPFLFGGIAGSGWVGFLAFVGVLVLNPIIWMIRKDAYFKSEQFQQLRAEVAGFVAEHNDVVNYVEEIRGQGSFELGSSSTGQYAHLATFENNSTWSNRRDRNVAQYEPHVHNASLQVVRNASADPIKYLMKYFSIKADQETLLDVQRVSEDIARLEQAVLNVKGREAAITEKIDPPAFILKRYAKEFWDQVGIHLSPITVPYPQYKFQYTSAGGNSGQSTGIKLNVDTLEAQAETLVQKIRWAKSAAGQRALMTERLRGEIKTRDQYTCQNLACGVSIADEPHLLLEVDHIVPVSKGGLSTHDNLRTLCWRCNRTKGAKLVS